MMNPTMFDPIALENWYSDDENSLLLQTELEKYFHLCGWDMKNNIIRDGSKDGFKVVILKMKNIIEKANANFCETIDQAGCSGRSSAKRQVLRFPLETRPFHCAFAVRLRPDRLLFRQDCWNS